MRGTLQSKVNSKKIPIHTVKLHFFFSIKLGTHDIMNIVILISMLKSRIEGVTTNYSYFIQLENSNIVRLLIYFYNVVLNTYFKKIQNKSI